MIWREPMPYVDSVKIQAKVDELNRGLPVPQWAAVSGENAFVSFTLTGNQTGIFNVNQGYPVKLFFNGVTNELKMFPLNLFLSLQT